MATPPLIVVMYASVFFCAVAYLIKWAVQAHDEQQKAAASRKPAVRCGNKSSGGYSSRRTGTAGSWSSDTEFDELTTEDYIILDDIEDMFD